jgi:hypothetical protein
MIYLALLLGLRGLSDEKFPVFSQLAGKFPDPPNARRWDLSAAPLHDDPTTERSQAGIKLA